MIAFRRDDDGTIRRVAQAGLGEGDDYCSLWHVFDLLEGGWNGWQPRRGYEDVGLTVGGRA